MAKAAQPNDAPTGPPLAQAQTFDGDPIVLVRLLTGSELLQCRAKGGKQRQIVVDGRPCEHVGEAPDGTWIYQMRTS